MILLIMCATQSLQSQPWGNRIKNKFPACPENLTTKVVEKENSFIIE